MSLASLMIWLTTISRRWDSTSSKYKIVSVIPVPEWDELDENMFVARRRIGEREREFLIDRH